MEMRINKSCMTNVTKALKTLLQRYMVVFNMSSTHRLDTSEPTDATIGWKKGVRVLGVAESFEKSELHSIMAGVIMRGDLRIDGFSVCAPTIGGSDSTDELVSMFKRLNRKDIRAWMLGGSVVSWFNIVDISSLHEATETPVICVSYHPSEGIEKYLREYFPRDWKTRLDVLGRTGERKQIHNRKQFLYIRSLTKKFHLSS